MTLATKKASTKKATTKKAPAKKTTAKRPVKEAQPTKKAPAKKQPKPEVDRLVEEKNPGRFINDSRGPTAPVLGQFVDVVSGEHQGRYGVFNWVSDDEKHAVVRTRDARTDLLNVEVKDLRPALAGRR